MMEPQMGLTFERVRAALQETENAGKRPVVRFTFFALCKQNASGTSTLRTAASGKRLWRLYSLRLFYYIE
ncbi:MAG: hypothetical protein LBH75_02775 [Treponema sp.]|jgi:hypothetical protein|nr:hypothetical protein [Treponema sp.]